MGKKKGHGSDGEEVEEQYHVEVITKARVDKDGDWEYRVKWANYDSSSDTWEPAENVAGCDRLLRSFWREVGMDNEDYEIGTVFEARPEWIAKEKAFFHANFGKTEKVVRRKKKRNKGGFQIPKVPVGKAVKSKNAKGKAMLKKPLVADSESEYETDDGSRSGSGSDSDVPLITKAGPKAGPSNRGQKRPALISSDSEGSDVPLRKAPRKDSLSGQKDRTNKGKEPIRPRPSTPTSSDLHSLFSAPPTPEPPKKQIPAPAPQATASGAGSSSSAGPKSSTTQTPASLPPKPPVPSHRYQEPKIKVMPMQYSDAAGNFTDTKRKLAARAGVIGPTDSPSDTLPPPLPYRRTSLAGLSFKKKSTTDAATQPSPTLPPPTQDPRKRPKSLVIPESQPRQSPVSTPTGAWGAGPSPTAATGGGWGSAASPTAATGTWGAGSSSTNTRGTGPSTTAAGGWGPAPSPPATTGGWGSAPSPPPTTGGWGASSPRDNTGTWGNTNTSSWGNDNNSSSQTGWGAQKAVAQQTTTAGAGPSTSTSDPRLAKRPAPQKNVNQAEAENFLASIMTAELAAPMIEPTGDDVEQALKVVPPPKVAKKADPPQEPAQEWEWCGDMSMETGPNTPATKICAISMSDPTTPRPVGLRLSVCYRTTTTSLQLEKFHDIPDIHLLLRACNPIQQFCRLSNKHAGDEKVFKDFGTYMTRRRQFGYARAFMDEEPVGILLVFPSSTNEICGLLKVPSELRTSPVLAALIPWKISAAQYKEHEWQRSPEGLGPGRERVQVKIAESMASLSKQATGKPQLGRGIRMHHFNSEEVEFFKRLQRRYCVWNAPSDGTVKEPGMETKALVAILDAWDAENVGYKQDVRVIFVHVGALPSLYKLEALATRRKKRPDLRFYSYGTHQSVHPDRWGIREIFPVGGVATFTAKAILEDPFEVVSLIEKFSQHPHWMCYIHPCVIAAVAKLSYPDSDIPSLTTENDYFCTPLLNLIEEGKLSLLYAPPKSRSPRSAENDTSHMVNPAMDWVAWALDISSMDSPGIMQECLKMFEKGYAKVPLKSLCSAVEKQVLSDIVQMQLEPAIMDNYRRFAMIVETRNDQNVERDGVELAQISEKFDFRDHYFD